MGQVRIVFDMLLYVLYGDLLSDGYLLESMIGLRTREQEAGVWEIV